MLVDDRLFRYSSIIILRADFFVSEAEPSFVPARKRSDTPALGMDRGQREGYR